MAEAKTDLILRFSRDGGISGYQLRVASTKEDGDTRAEELAAKLRPFLAEGVTLSAYGEPSRFAR